MRHFLQSILLWTLIGLGSTSLRAQCDIQISDLSPCGETLVTFSALNPSGNYSWDLNEDNVIDAAGSSVSYQLPSTTSDLIYSVVLYENTAPCDTLSFVIQAQPDPSIDVVPGNAIFTDDLIRACSATPQTTLQIFNASTTIPQNDTYTINWGDGTVENFTNATFPNTSFISHDYSAYGYYNITVTISGTNGCSDSRTYLFYNGSNPSVGLANPGNTVGLCAPATINFPITNTGNNPTGTEYFIYIGGEVVDSFSQNNVPAIYSYTFLESSCGLGTSTGNYENAFDVQVIASNPCGTSQATIEPIEVSTPPVPIFIVDQPTLGCVDDIFAISDASANVNEVISGNPSVCESSLSPSWTISPGVSGIDWTIVSGNIFSSNQIEIVFQTPGTYTITMTINSPACGSGSFGQTFTILEPPVAGATLDLNSAAAPSLPDECVPTLGSFINQSTGDSISFEWVVSPPTGWQYGPNSGPLEDHLDLVFDQGGTYDITLLTTNPCTTDSWDTTIVIATDPLANLTPFPPFCETATLNFDNLSVQVAENGGTISSYQWSFPGASPSSSTAALPQNIQYDSPGVYPYTLTVENQCGTHTVTDTVRVEAEGSLVLDNDYALCQDETAFQLSANPGGGTWNGTGVTIDGLFTPGSNTVGTNTLYYMYLNGACVLQDSLEVTVFPAPDVVAGASQAVCVDSPPILITGGDPVGGTWSATDGGVITGADAFDPAASGPGAYTLVYSVTNVDGCTGTDSKTIVVYDLPTVEAGPDQSLCENPNDISLTGFTPAGGVWTGTGVSPGGVFNAGNTPGPGDYTLFYTYTNPNTSCTNLDSMTVSVVPNDTARAGIDLNLCLNANPVLLSGTPANGTWSGPGVDPINNTFDPSGLNPGPQVLTYTFGTGVCETTDERIMNLVAPPQIRMIDDPRICVNDGPFDLSSVSPAGGTWQGDGLQGTSFNPALVGPGTYELRYFYQDPVTRCADIAWLNVEVLGLPELTVNDTTICNTGGAVLLPQYAPLGGSWSGTGLVDDDAFDPAVAGGTGQYDLTYTFTDAEGCTNTAISAITVVEPVQISAGPNDSICMDAGMITLGNFFPLNGTWTGTGIIDSVAGTFDPNVTGGGTHEVTYSYGLGNCRVTDTKEIHVIDLSNIHLGEAVSYCVYEAAVQFEAEGPAGGFWSGPGIVDSINGIFDPSAAGDGLHSIRYFYQDPNVGCVASATKPVTVFPMEDASFDFPAVACTNTTVAFQNTSDSSYTTQWDFGDRTSSIAFSPIHVYDTVGTYPVELIVTNEFGCRDVLVQDILITEAPDPGFALSEEEGCAPLAVEFTNQSSGFEVAFDWDFGNGESSTDISPPAIVYGPGINDTTYTVQLTVSNLCGSREVERPVLVRPLPLADFGSTPVTICSPQEVAFANISTGSATNFFWDFGNGETSTDSLPRNQIYVADSAETTYTIRLVAGNVCGLDTAYQDIVVDPADVQSFFNVSDRVGCEPFTIDFFNFATPGATIGWDFGDGNTSDQSEPIHTYTEPGTFRIIQFATNVCGYDTSSTWVTVLPSPEVEFQHEPFVCLGQEIQFFNESIDLSGSYWDFGDGDTSVLHSPVHVYDSAGVFTVTLVGNSQFNQCPATYTSQVIVQALPEAEFAPAEPFGCVPFTTTFLNNSQGSNFYVWNFGDGNTSVDPNPTHTFTEVGTYVVQLVARDDNGCFNDTSLLNVQVYPVPEAGFEFDRDLLCGLPVELDFTDTSVGAGDYQWTFGDGGESAFNEPVYRYDTAGTFDIKLLVSNEFNCRDSITERITTYAQPIADFEPGAYSGCSPLEVNFLNNSLYSNNFQWEFGNGSTSEEEDGPRTTYDTAATYSVRLIASIDGVCFDTLEQEQLIEVFPTPFANFEYEAPDPDFASGEYNFYNLSEDATSYYWEFTEGGSSTETNPSYRYFVNGERQVYLEASNDFGCVDDTTMNFTPEFFGGLFIPTGFSPELGIGDVRLFKPVGTGLKEYHVQVFSPYGLLLWESTALENGSPTEAWDGSYNGKILPQDVYVWKVSGIFEDGTAWKGQKDEGGKVKTIGSVVIIR